MPRSTDVAVWEQLVRFHRTATREMDRRLREAFGHSLDDYDVLRQCSMHGAPIRMGDLAERLLVANSSCHRIVTRLVDAGLLTRSHPTDDLRVTLVQLTQTGRRVHRRMAIAHTRDIEAALGDRLGTDQANLLNEMMQELLERSVPDVAAKNE